MERNGKKWKEMEESTEAERTEKQKEERERCISRRRQDRARQWKKSRSRAEAEIYVPHARYACRLSPRSRATSIVKGLLYFFDWMLRVPPSFPSTRRSLTSSSLFAAVFLLHFHHHHHLLLFLLLALGHKLRHSTIARCGENRVRTQLRIYPIDRERDPPRSRLLLLFLSHSGGA